MAFDVVEGTKAMCYFCGQSFDSVAEKNDHILVHFERKRCFGCDNELIAIGGKWYQQHIDDNCTAIKLEPHYDDAEMADPLITAYHATQNEPLSGPFIENDPFAEIFVPESNALDDDLAAEQEQLGNILSDFSETVAHSANAKRTDVNETATGVCEAIAKPSPRLYPCRVCPTIFKYAKNRVLHMKVIHPHVQQRMGRPRTRPSRGILARALPRASRCSLCPAVFLLQRDRDAHTSRMHGAQTNAAKNEVREELVDVEPSAETTNVDDQLGAPNEPIQLQGHTIDNDGLHDNDYADEDTSNLFDIEPRRSHKRQPLDGANVESRAIDDETGDESLAESSSSATERGRPVVRPRSFRKRDVELWACSMCEYTSIRTPNMYKHMRNVHGVDDWDQAIPIFNADEFIGRPSAADAEARRWSCAVCSHTTTSAADMYEHIRVAHKSSDTELAIPMLDTERLPTSGADAKLWTCSRCSHTTRKSYMMYKHIYSAHASFDKQLAIPVYDMDEYVAKRKLEPKQPTRLRCRDVELWSCLLCPHVSRQCSNIYKHLRQKHNSDDKSLAEPVVDVEQFQAKRAAEMRTLRARKLEVKLWSCDLCAYAAAQSATVHAHLLAVHDADDTRLAKPVTDLRAFAAERLAQPPPLPPWLPPSTVLNPEIWSCTLCSHATLYAANVLKHLRQVHQSVDKALAELLLSAGPRTPADPSDTRTAESDAHFDESDDEAAESAVIEAQRLALAEPFDEAEGVKPSLVKRHGSRLRRFARMQDGPSHPNDDMSADTEANGSAGSSAEEHVDADEASNSNEASGDGSVSMPDENGAAGVRRKRGRPRKADSKWPVRARKMSGNDGRSCALCPYDSSSTSNMYKHLRNVHGTDDKSKALRRLPPPPPPGTRTDDQVAVPSSRGMPRRRAVVDRPGFRVGVVLPGTNKKVYPCEFCPATLSSPQNRYTHVKRMHKSGEPSRRLGPRPKPRPAMSAVFACASCPAAFLVRENRAKHMQCVHGLCAADTAEGRQTNAAASSAAPQANESLATPPGTPAANGDGDAVKSPNAHQSASDDRDVKMWLCALCPKRTLLKVTMAGHLQSSHGTEDLTMARPILDWSEAITDREPIGTRTFVCKICKKRVLSSITLKRHMFIAHGINIRIESLTCDYCSAQFDDKAAVHVHKRKQHAKELDDDKVIKCELCPALFDRYYIRRAHYINDHGIRPHPKEFKCPECRSVFKFPAALIEHLKDVHDHLDEYKCGREACGESFATVDELHAHMKNHPVAETKRLTCAKCTKDYTEWAYYTHKCVPPGSEIYICDYCGKQFNILYSFKEHLNRHTNNRTYSCQFCERKFASPGTRTTHQRTHTGERPCKCRVAGCDRAFVQHTDLYRHQYKAHGIFRKKFPCTVCDAVFPENALLRKHLVTHGIVS